MVKNKVRNRDRAPILQQENRGSVPISYLSLAFNHLPLAVLPELFSQSQALNDRSVTLRILFLHIVQKPSPLADELQQPPAGMVVLFMLLEMIGQVSDASTQERDLNFRRPCIGRVQLETTDNSFSFFYI
jgi:hypothetical protein